MLNSEVICNHFYPQCYIRFLLDQDELLLVPGQLTFVIYPQSLFQKSSLLS